jgi:hypothetical protein
MCHREISKQRLHRHPSRDEYSSAAMRDRIESDALGGGNVIIGGTR